MDPYSATRKVAGPLVTGRSLQNAKTCHWQEQSSDTVPLFIASRIFRNCTSQIMEWPGTMTESGAFVNSAVKGQFTLSIND